MTRDIPTLVAEARAFADRDNGLNWQGRVRELADALEAEHRRAESATMTGERILADALRYQNSGTEDTHE